MLTFLLGSKGDTFEWIRFEFSASFKESLFSFSGLLSVFFAGYFKLSVPFYFSGTVSRILVSLFCFEGSIRSIVLDSVMSMS